MRPMGRPSSEANPLMIDDDPPRILASPDPPETAETCKFSPEEQVRLLALRSCLVRCASKLQDLEALVRKDGGSATGLPRLAETRRARLLGQTFSVEDASREFCNDWLAEKMRHYVQFVDHALADQLGADEASGGEAHSDGGLDTRALLKSAPVALVPSPVPVMRPLGCP